MLTLSSQELFEQAQALLVGGVDSPVRAFKGVGETPPFIKEAKNSHMITEDGQSLIDYVLAWGPLLLGHAHPNVVAAICETAAQGTAFGAPSKLEIQLAQLVQEFYPSCQKVRFVNSGTEATMTALRLARGWTKRDKIIKFKGCYHGHSDSLLVQAGSGALTFSQPDSDGVPQEFVQHTLLCDFNDLEGVKKLFDQYDRQIAGIIVEPVVGNMGVVLPNPGFLEGLRQLCEYEDAVLIFDEVMTGFRVDLGGAQGLYQIEPDLTCLGKVIGGGLPCGAVGGKHEIMMQLAPVGKVYQAGTMSGNPLAMAAGIATLTLLRNQPHLFTQAAAKTKQLVDGWRQVLEKMGLKYQINSIGTMFTLFFAEKPVVDLPSALRSDRQKFAHFFHAMLKQGVNLAPSQFEANFMSAAHTDEDIENTIAAFAHAIQGLNLQAR